MISSFAASAIDLNTVSGGQGLSVFGINPGAVFGIIGILVLCLGVWVFVKTRDDQASGNLKKMINVLGASAIGWLILGVTLTGGVALVTAGVLGFFGAFT